MKTKSSSRLITVGLLLCITLIGAVLRFWRLTDNPPGLYIDEVSIGYNAFALLTTGKDEHGVTYPYWFEAFGEQKLPVFIYSVLGCFILFGQSDFAVRLPSALAGVLSIPLVFLLSRFLFQKSAFSASKYSLVTSFLFAISPWSLQFSRAGFEANLGLFLVLLGVVCLFFSFEKQKWIYLSIPWFLLAISTYNSLRLFVPLLLLAILIIYKKSFQKHKKTFIKALIVGALLFVPIATQQIAAKGFNRAQDVSYIYSQPIIQAVHTFIGKYVTYFDPTFLFFHGDQIGRHSVRKLGMMNHYDLVLVLIGVLALRKLDRSHRYFIIAWLVIAPIPAALTTIAPHALRSLHLLPGLIMLTGLGLSEIIDRIVRFKIPQVFKKIALAGIPIMVVYYLMLYISEYHVRYPTIVAIDWGDGYRETVQLIKEKHHNYKNVFISDQLPLLYLAYYLPIPPKEYRQLIETQTSDRKFSNLHYFDTWKQPEPDNPTLMVTHWSQPPSEGINAEVIGIAGGDTAFFIWERP